MSNHPDHFRPHTAVGSDQYLESAIRTASPARLRLMMIERGIEVSERLAIRWRENPSEGENEHSLKLLEILNELLGGVTAGATEGETAVCHVVADLYVFLTQHLMTAEARSDSAAIEEIRLVLLAEAETWRLVCANEATGSITVASPPAIVGPEDSAIAPSDGFTASKGLNFEA